MTHLVLSIANRGWLRTGDEGLGVGGVGVVFSPRGVKEGVGRALCTKKSRRWWRIKGRR
jgi:hypothetical protein